MNNINEELFTDYAMEFISAYLSNDKEILADLLKSFGKDEFSNPSFIPGTMFGLVIHISMLLNHIAMMNNETTDESFRAYAYAYNLSRADMMNNDILSPKKANEFFNKWIDEGGDYKTN